MACPNCGCKETYAYYDSEKDLVAGDDSLERCAACGHIFDIEDSTYEDDMADQEKA